jgi:hypothetical protein
MAPAAPLVGWPIAGPFMRLIVAAWSMAAARSIPSSGVRRVAALLLLGTTVAPLAGCSSDDNQATAPVTLVDFAGIDPDIRPGDVIALRQTSVNDGGLDGERAVEWIERRTGKIKRLVLNTGDGWHDSSATATDIETLATIDVGIDGEQRGLLGHTVIDGVRYAAWTEPTANHLLVGEVDADGAGRVVWNAGGTAGGAVGGHLEADADGNLILGIGQLTDWAKAHGSGAMVQLDPDGPSDQDPIVLSDGYINPFAFTTTDTQLWVADNAVGNDVERIGRGDLGGRDTFAPTGVAPRAPSAMIALGDGRLAVCGFLDAQLRPWSPGTGTYGDTLGPCLTGAVVLPDGSIVTATTDALVVLPSPRP